MIVPLHGSRIHDRAPRDFPFGPEPTHSSRRPGRSPVARPRMARKRSCVFWCGTALDGLDRDRAGNSIAIVASRTSLFRPERRRVAEDRPHRSQRTRRGIRRGKLSCLQTIEISQNRKYAATMSALRREPATTVSLLTLLPSLRETMAPQGVERRPVFRRAVAPDEGPFKFREAARTLTLAVSLSTLEEIGKSERRRVWGRTVRRRFGDSRPLWGGLESGDDSPIRRNPGHPKAILGYVVGSRRTRTATFRGG